MIFSGVPAHHQHGGLFSSHLDAQGKPGHTFGWYASELEIDGCTIENFVSCPFYGIQTGIYNRRTKELKQNPLFVIKNTKIA